MGNRSGVNAVLVRKFDSLSRQYRLTLREFLLWMFRCRKRYHVEGGSMEPMFTGGEEVLVQSYFGRSDARGSSDGRGVHSVKRHVMKVGDVVVVRHPSRRDFLLVKRVHQVDAKHDVIEVRGLNTAVSTDSRSFGPVHRKDILGRVTAVLK